MDAPDETRDFARTLRRRLSLPEGLLWRAIKGRKAEGLHFRRQHPVGPYVLDFYCAAAGLAVEVDGRSHDFDSRPAADARRDAFLSTKGIRTLRLPAHLVLTDLDAAVRTIVGAANGEL